MAARFELRAAALAALTLLAAPAAASVSVYMPPEHLARRAEIVVEGTVSGTESGLDPESGTLATYVTLAVRAVHRGPADLQEIVLREPGGSFGDVVHEVDAAPRYRVGEQVFAFLEPAGDGALRTTGMFFGKFEIEEGGRGSRLAVRDLEGRGPILGRGSVARESLAPADLVALTATLAPPPAPEGRSDSWSARPPEFGRVIFERAADSVPAGPDGVGTIELARGTPAAPAAPRFVPLAASNPTRWSEADAGVAVPVHVQPRGNPLGDDALAVEQVRRALEAWTDVAEGRIALVPGDPDFDYVGRHDSSPARTMGTANIVLFDDPYGDIPDPVGCSGVIAIGGYWRSASATEVVNGRSFASALQLYVIFNNDFECLLGDPDDLSEVAAHELGHGLGFGHSADPDSIMRPSPYLGRGPRLGDDDVDGLHCHYPHALSITFPRASDLLVPGQRARVRWEASLEAGPDEGTVDLELSTDGGQTWRAVAADEPNDGEFTWRIPALGEGAELRLVRRTRGAWAAAEFGGTCTESAGVPLRVAAPTETPGPVGARRGVGRKDGLRAPAPGRRR